MSRARFGPFEFDTATGELWMEGRRVRLQRQPSRLLELLVGRPGDVVSREEIRQGIWGDDTHVDFERSLNFCVAKLRSALRDNAASPRYVETLPTRGYRFNAAAPGGDVPTRGCRFIGAVEPPAAGIAAPPAPLAAQAPGIDRGPERQWAA